MSAAALEQLLFADPTVLPVLKAVQTHASEGAYVAAGFVRNRVWDSRYAPKASWPEGDIDVVFHDPADLGTDREKAVEAALAAALPGHDWQVRNQARMHVPAGDAPYQDIEDALSCWPETATAVAVRLGPDGRLEIVAPHGLGDLMGHILRPSPAILGRDETIFETRVREKGWLKRWPDLTVPA